MMPLFHAYLVRRIPVDLWADIQRKAEIEQRSLGRIVVRLIRQGMRVEEAQSGPVRVECDIKISQTTH